MDWTTFWLVNGAVVALYGADTLAYSVVMNEYADRHGIEAWLDSGRRRIAKIPLGSLYLYFRMKHQEPPHA